MVAFDGGFGGEERGFSAAQKGDARCAGLGEVAGGFCTDATAASCDDYGLASGGQLGARG